mmetsp:Transcript_3273/g.8349  ORF Transcript_3273/g.8349 Transcript_3273/m.8349 type:complete len:98 (+) Transcript_3273:106-399(+)
MIQDVPTLFSKYAPMAPNMPETVMYPKYIVPPKNGSTLEMCIFCLWGVEHSGGGVGTNVQPDQPETNAPFYIGTKIAWLTFTFVDTVQATTGQNHLL